MGKHRVKDEQRDYAQNLDQLRNLRASARGCGVLRQVATDNVPAVDLDLFVDVDRSIPPIGDPANAIVASLPIERRECHFERLDSSLRFWRTLALALLRAIQRRDWGLARTAGTIAEPYGLIIDFQLSQVNPHSRLLRRLDSDLREKLSGLDELLKRGKNKPPATPDEALVDLYGAFARVIPIVRRLERSGKSAECAETIVIWTFPVANPFGPHQDGLIEKLTKLGPQARLDALLRGAACWAGLPTPSDVALEKMRMLLMSQRAPAETAKMILAGLTVLSVKTISNRLTGKIRFTH